MHFVAPEYGSKYLTRSFVLVVVVVCAKVIFAKIWVVVIGEWIVCVKQCGWIIRFS